MKCARCKNEDSDLFFELNGKAYCRKCIEFKRIEISFDPMHYSFQTQNLSAKYNLAFELSLQQSRISNRLVENFKNSKNSYVWACTGSGKTEICYKVIQYALNSGNRVCFCIPRTELVKELYNRIRNDFSNIDIGLVYGGHNENSDSQFVICTMHQLYRFVDTGFNLMIADEVDAFPYYNNEVLAQIFESCCRGTFIKLSATFVKEDIINGELLVMNKRYHNYLLPVPHVLMMPKIIQRYICLLTLLITHKQYIVFAATIEEVLELTNFLKKYVKVKSISSKTQHKDEVLNALRNKEIKAIVSTTLLERGITIEDIQVMVMNASHINFDSRTLIQISGRVGRKINHPTGYVLFLTNQLSDGIKGCIKTIKFLNKQDA